MLEPTVPAAEIENTQGFSRIEYPEKSHHAASFHLPLGGVTSSNVPEGKILQILDVGTSPAGLLPSQPVRIGKCAKARTVRFPNEHRDIACHGEFMTWPHRRVPTSSVPEARVSSASGRKQSGHAKTWRA